VVDDVFGTEQLAAAVMRVARRYAADMRAAGGLPDGMDAETAARLQAIAMLRSAMFLIESTADDDDDRGGDDEEGADFEEEYADDE